MRRTAFALIAFAQACCASDVKLFADCDKAELIAAAPELNGLEFDPDQKSLAELLRAAGGQLSGMFAKLINVSIAEDVHELRFDREHKMWIDQREKFRYTSRAIPFSESRPGGAAQRAFLLAGGFLAMLEDLLPERQRESRFRYLGRAENSLVIAFTLRDESRQGLAWLDEATKRVVRLRTDVLKSPDAQQFDSFTRDVRFVPVKFAALESAPWLPASAVVHARFAPGELHSVHRFSDYRVDGFEKDADAAQLKEDTGEAPPVPALAEDGFELLQKGIAALQGQKAGDAVAPLREAAALLPTRFEALYCLGLALRGTRDFAGAEARFRQAVKIDPSAALAHNELGGVLFERGDFSGARAEFQEALRLEPANAAMRANLEAAAKKLETDVTIKVAVRQVLVPVVVTDKEGHHVTGLTQADFKIFEDGIEQKISAFTSERSDMPGAPVAQAAGPAAAPPKPLATRHAYIVCVDTLHASFGNFAHVRDALQKLFGQEAAGDSQYAVIGLGKSMQIVQNTTSDPSKV